jgi:hypothetical protein
MPEIPRHPGGDADEPAAGRAEPGAARRRASWLWWAVGLGLLVAFVVLHLTGVLGPGAH